MGIRGLFSFVESYDDFFDDVKLKDKKLVVDGSNLRYLLYHWCPRMNSCYGGDYRKYYDYSVAFVKKLLDCNIRPVVVMDGAHDTTGIKKSTVVRRAKDQARNAVQCGDPTKWSKNKKPTVLPLFALDVFFQVLEDLSVETVQTNFEADRYIAELASLEGCPVASNDSDFFVYDVDFLPLDSFRFNSVEIDHDGSRYITCRRFNKTNFLKSFNFTTCDHLYLMSSVLGNDYIPIHSFEKFFSQVRMPKKKSMAPRRKQMLGFLHWLSREPDPDLAVEKILSHISLSERPRLKTLIENSVAVYKSSANSGALLDEVFTKDGSTIPSWFMQEFRSCRHPNWLMDAICNGQFILPSQIESRSSTSSHLFALPILQTTLNLCGQFGGALPATFKLFTREGGTSKAVTLECDGGEVDVQNLRGFSEKSRREFLLQALRLDISESLPEGFELMAMALVFWTKNETEAVHKSLWKSLSLSWVMTLFSDADDDALGRVPCLNDIVGKIRSVSSESRDSFLETIKRLSRTNQEIKKVDLSSVYRLSNFQATLYHLGVLCKVLNSRWNLFCPSEMFNGTLIYNIHNDLDGHNDVDHRCKALLGFNSEIIAAYEAFLDILKPFMEYVSSAGKVNRGKAKSKKKCKKDSEIIVQDLGNRFDLLGLD